MVEEVLEGVSGHFLPRHKLWLKDVRTLAMHRGGWEVHSQTDYILVTDIHLFQNVAVLGRKSQHVPLPGLGLPPWSRTCRAFTIPREAYMLPHQASGDPGQGRPYVCQAPTGHPQAISAGTSLSGLDLT